MAQWRRMEVTDLAAVEALGSAFHVHHPEGPDIAPERQRLAPGFCFVLDDPERGFSGYCVAHPWRAAMPPGLDVLLGRLPEQADALHVHDVVLHDSARGLRHTQALLASLLAKASSEGLHTITLIAVGDAGTYWSRQGFSDDPDPAKQRFVRHSYGEDATPMRRSIEIGRSPAPIAGA